MKISKRQLTRIIREEAEAHWGGGEDEYKRSDGHKSGDVDGHYKDYEGPEGGNLGDESETDPGHLDYEDPVHHKAKAAVAAIQDLASAAGVDVTASVDGETLTSGGDVHESRRNRKTSYKQLRRIIREEADDATADADADDAKDEGEEEVQEESRRRMKRKLRRIVRETRRNSKRRLNEDEIDKELDNLHKNIGDDIEHIRSLKDDIKDDHDEEKRAEEDKERKDETLKRKLRKIVRENTRSTRRSRRSRR